MEFDWYQATVMEPTDRFLQWADATYSDCERTDRKGHNHYLHRADYAREGILMLSVSHGGPNGFPNAKATSSAAPRFANAVRRAFPRCDQIRVTRVDSCQDFEGPGAFDLAHGAMKQLSEERKIRTELVGDWDRAEFGRSYYLGSKESAFRAVLYEKGIESAKEIAAAGLPPRPNLCRLEGRLRPQYPEAKTTASTFTPLDVWAACRWGPALVHRVLSLDIQRIKMSEYQVPEMTLSAYSMVRQYRRTVQHIIVQADHDESCVGKYLMDIADSIEREHVP